jgi:hypothetical protein
MSKQTTDGKTGYHKKKKKMTSQCERMKTIFTYIIGNVLEIMVTKINPKKKINK